MPLGKAEPETGWGDLRHPTSRASGLSTNVVHPGPTAVTAPQQDGARTARAVLRWQGTGLAVSL
jgi:hypothetical protein